MTIESLSNIEGLSGISDSTPIRDKIAISCM